MIQLNFWVFTTVTLMVQIASKKKASFSYRDQEEYLLFSWFFLFGGSFLCCYCCFHYHLCLFLFFLFCFYRKRIKNAVRSILQELNSQKYLTVVLYVMIQKKNNLCNLKIPPKDTWRTIYDIKPSLIFKHLFKT